MSLIRSTNVNSFSRWCNALLWKSQMFSTLPAFANGDDVHDRIRVNKGQSKTTKKRRKKTADDPKQGINLSKTKSYLQGSFLLTDENNTGQFTAADVLDETKERNQFSDILVQLQSQNQGPNVSLFYKQNGGVVATRGKGAMVYQDPQFSRSGNSTPFLDVANNVAGVGHSHPLVVKASLEEMNNIQV